MREEPLYSKNKDLVIVLDTTAFLIKYPLYHYGRLKLVTSPLVIDEVRDRDNREALELALSIGRVEVIDPSSRYLETVANIARDIGEHSALSRTDISVIALALEYKEKGYRVVIITDDYALQNTLLHIGIPFKPLRTQGIKFKYRYLVTCPGCGYVSRDLGEKTCPLCGTRLVKKVSLK